MFTFCPVLLSSLLVLAVNPERDCRAHCSVFLALSFVSSDSHTHCSIALYKKLGFEQLWKWNFDWGEWLFSVSSLSIVLLSKNFLVKRESEKWTEFFWHQIFILGVGCVYVCLSFTPGHLSFFFFRLRHWINSSKLNCLGLFFTAFLYLQTSFLNTLPNQVFTE